MASSTPIVVPDAQGSKSLLGLGAAVLIDVACVYFSALHLSPWFVGRWFSWVAPTLQISVSKPATDWYLQHLEMVTITPALILGYLHLTRFLVVATLPKYIEERRSYSAAVGVWIVPALALGYRMLIYHPPSSVFYSSSMSAIRYFFVIQKVMPTIANPNASDPIRVLAQMTVTAPFYAGIAYSLGALGQKHRLLINLFTFGTHDQSKTAPE